VPSMCFVGDDATENAKVIAKSRYANQPTPDLLPKYTAYSEINIEACFSAMSHKFTIKTKQQDLGLQY
jgi:hypothetical protein